jgi:hypothetical protein
MGLPTLENDETYLFKVSHEMNQWIYTPVKDLFEAMKSILLFHNGTKQEKFVVVFDVLLVVCLPSLYCTIMVMCNLSNDQYILLHPTDYNNNLSVLWETFSKDIILCLMYLVEEYQDVFSDLQIGWDYKSNVLVCQSNTPCDM